MSVFRNQGPLCNPKRRLWQSGGGGGDAADWAHDDAWAGVGCRCGWRDQLAPGSASTLASTLHACAGKAMPLYERALSIYEAHYGPNHPEVAHTLTDLAVLHLEQVRRCARAAPVLCVLRVALRVPVGHDAGRRGSPTTGQIRCLAARKQESQACARAVAAAGGGAQGNDGVGRPLLERALAIQEKALGPDHPDVIAIKDVLNS